MGGSAVAERAGGFGEHTNFPAPPPFLLSHAECESPKCVLKPQYRQACANSYSPSDRLVLGIEMMLA